MKRFVCLLVLVLPAPMLAACGAAAIGSAPPPSAATSSAGTGYQGRPVDSSIAPVSRSHPIADAAAALTACDIGDGNRIGLDAVAGMGMISTASELPRYVYLTGLEPELRDSGAAWAIQISGQIVQYRIQETWIDPVCIVIGGIPTWFGSGPTVIGTGAPVPPPKVSSPPTLALPGLAP